QRHPYGRLILRLVRHQFETWSEHPHNDVADIVQPHCTAENVGFAAKVTLPCAIAQDRYVFFAKPVFFVEEISPELHARTQQAEEIGRDGSSGKPCRFAVT